MGRAASCCAVGGRGSEQALAYGAQEITILVRHALFTGERWRELPALGVKQIYVTDSVPDAQRRGG
jgi:phosphoribosylpyrophosphate synthetase